LAAATRSGFAPPPWLVDGGGKVVGAKVLRYGTRSLHRQCARSRKTELPPFFPKWDPEIVAAIGSSSVAGAIDAIGLAELSGSGANAGFVRIIVGYAYVQSRRLPMAGLPFWKCLGCWMDCMNGHRIS
jgi:hypothetical protein